MSKIQILSGVRVPGSVVLSKCIHTVYIHNYIHTPNLGTNVHVHGDGCKQILLSTCNFTFYCYM